MEVHHPHHPTHKKKWSEYILEFFLLFTAVTLGFFAENLREHQVEIQKTKKSLNTLYLNIQKDSISNSYANFTNRNLSFLNGGSCIHGIRGTETVDFPVNGSDLDVF